MVVTCASNLSNDRHTLYTLSVCTGRRKGGIVRVRVGVKAGRKGDRTGGRGSMRRGWRRRRRRRRRSCLGCRLNSLTG